LQGREGVGESRVTSSHSPPLQRADSWQPGVLVIFHPTGLGIHGGLLGSLVPIAAWLNPLLTTGYAVEISKYFNIQPRGMQNWLESMVASGLTMEEARAVQGHN
jgi:hypothetical protein